MIRNTGAKENPEDIDYVNNVVREVTEETYGFLIFQEQIAMLAHKLVKIWPLMKVTSRKLLTKRYRRCTNREREIFDKFKDVSRKE